MQGIAPFKADQPPAWLWTVPQVISKQASPVLGSGQDIMFLLRHMAHSLDWLGLGHLNPTSTCLSKFKKSKIQRQASLVPGPSWTIGPIQKSKNPNFRNYKNPKT